MPVDNPATHLELTMIHEAMVLEYSGRYLALIEWAAAMKLVVFLSLIANLFAPWGIATTLAPAAIGIGLVAYILKIAGLAVLIGILESMIAKLRLFRVTELLGTAFILALLGGGLLLHLARMTCRSFSSDIGSQLVNLSSALLLITCFAIVTLRRLSACINAVHSAVGLSGHDRGPCRILHRISITFTSLPYSPSSSRPWSSRAF